MPPRFAYWTILIDNAPTAFRARDPQELLPTLNQLKRKNSNVVMKWFARGRLWESQQQERDDFQRRKRGTQRKSRRPLERRGRDWRPGGEHKDPRARFDKKAAPRQTAHGRPTERRGRKPWREKIRAKGAAGRPPRGEQEPDKPERRPPEPTVPKRPDYTSEPVPEAPPPSEQIVTKPEPPERG